MNIWKLKLSCSTIYNCIKYEIDSDTSDKKGQKLLQ